MTLEFASFTLCSLCLEVDVFPKMTLLSLMFLPALSILAAVTNFSCVCFFAG